ncbi:SPOR domain-containing protein [Aquimarina sp. W85]|uniref:SPOR domain-containing protein n=1 Tax=Aquimarina rhodophyticola TaxID=3342246 RepID=UPI003672E628
MRILNKNSYITFSGICILSCLNINAQDTLRTNPEVAHQLKLLANNQVERPHGEITINQDPKIKYLLDVKSKMDKDGAFSDRYKIQLYYGSLNQANDIKKSADNVFPEWRTSIKYETPNYKVWLGNYRSRLEADRALIKVRKEFPSAFIFKPEK